MSLKCPNYAQKKKSLFFFVFTEHRVPKDQTEKTRGKKQKKHILKFREHRVPKDQTEKTRQKRQDRKNTKFREHRVPRDQTEKTREKKHKDILMFLEFTEHRVPKDKTKKHKHISEREAKSQQIAEQSLLSCLQCFLSTKSSA